MLIFLAFFLLLSLSFEQTFGQATALAEDKELEITYPKIPGFRIPSTVKTDLFDYLKYIFVFFIAISGLLAFFMIIYAGVRYLTSTGKPSVMADARDQITSAFLGLLILLFSIVVLKTINPQIVKVSLPKVPLPAADFSSGILLCKSQINLAIQNSGNKEEIEKEREKINRECVYPSMPGTIPSTFRYLYLNPASNYGIILHQKENNHGQCRVFPDSINSSYYDLTGFKFASLIPYLKNTLSDGGGVTLFEKGNFNKDEPGARFSFGTGYKGNVAPFPNDSARSIEFQNPHEVIAVLFDGADFSGECQVFNEDFANLTRQPIGQCGPFWSKKPCTSAIQVIAATIF